MKNGGVQKMNKIKSTKGITLIALIVIIIVLLILAGVVINLTIGENGIFSTAQTAKEKTAVAELKEKADIEYTSLKVENYEKEIKLLEIVERLRKQGYTIVTTSNGEKTKITGVTAEPESLILKIEETRRNRSYDK